jgi:hypothetical protein
MLRNCVDICRADREGACWLQASEEHTATPSVFFLNRMMWILIHLRNVTIVG